MLQPSHRGIYEYLWSEHKYQIIGVSLKAYQNLATRLGRRPQTLAFLRRLDHLCREEKPEYYNALLNAYMHVKPLLEREERFQIIETLLHDESAATEMIFAAALRHDEKSLYGCRLFYASGHAICKFWDAQDRAGLWNCFGPMQLHRSAQQIFSRIALRTDNTAETLQQKLNHLAHGIGKSEWTDWPDSLKLELQRYNMVAITGTMTRLHPRIVLPDSFNIVREATDIYQAASETVERIQDCSVAAGAIAVLPDYQTFCRHFCQEQFPHLLWEKSFSAEEAYDFLATLFWEQQCRENGLTAESEIIDDSGAGVGMEPADEEIDTEESEHGDNESDY
jgi:hypothetical protein